jgi:hypothetical protein
MAISCLMNWQASRTSWYRMYLGKQYQVSDEQATKTISITGRNGWPQFGIGNRQPQWATSKT